MSIKTDKAAQNHQKGYNCAQAVACAFAEEMGIDESIIFQDDGRSRIRNGLHGRNMWSNHRSRCSHRCHKKAVETSRNQFPRQQPIN